MNKLVGSLTHVLLLGKEFSGDRALGQADNKIIAGRKVTSVISDRNHKSEFWEESEQRVESRRRPLLSDIGFYYTPLGYFIRRQYLYIFPVRNTPVTVYSSSLCLAILTRRFPFWLSCYKWQKMTIGPLILGSWVSRCRMVQNLSTIEPTRS